MFSFFKKSCIGIDIGANSLKLVQLSLKNKRYLVENYVIAENKNIFAGGDLKELNLKLLDENVVLVIKEALKRGKITGSKDAIVSIPAYLSFITVIEMPLMSQDELEKAVQFEARQYIPIPINEVMLDWQVINSTQAENKPNLVDVKPEMNVPKEKKEVMEILLVAVPKYLVDKYKEVIPKSGLVLKNIEVENFSLVRSILGNDKSTVIIVDFGGQSTDVNLISEGMLRESRTLDVNGMQMTKILASSLNISQERADSLKKERGIISMGGEEEFTKVILPIVDSVSEEIKRMQRSFLLKKKKSIERIILTGGVANMPGIVDYLNKKLELEVGIGNPFKRMLYPQELNRDIIEIAPVTSIAAGLAMRGL